MLSKEQKAQQAMFIERTKRAKLEKLTCIDLNTLGFQMHAGHPNNNWYGLERTDINLVAKVLKEKEQEQNISIL